MGCFEPNVALPAALIGEPSRAAILLALCGAEQHAGALARVVSASPQATSNHLAKLMAGGLVAARNEGRHRYYFLANPDVARVLELLATLAPPVSPSAHIRSGKGAALEFARTCYDHLAGKLGVAVAEAMEKRGMLARRVQHGEHEYWGVTRTGHDWLVRLGIDVAMIRGPRERLARCCFDRTEHRHHLAGSLGVSLLRQMVEMGWVERDRGTRAVRLTSVGRRALQEQLGIDIRGLAHAEYPVLAEPLNLKSHETTFSGAA